MAEPIVGEDQSCSRELNNQIQGLMARVSQCENDIVAHFQGISMLVAALADTPAAAAADVMASIYNFEAVGFRVLQMLIQSISLPDFKQLSLELANALISGMANQLAGMIEDLTAQLTAIVDNLVAVVDDLREQLENAPAEMIDELTAQLAEAESQLKTAMDNLATLPSFLGAQKDAAACKSKSLRIKLN